VVAGPGALDALADVVAGLSRADGDVVVLAAATPMSAGGRDLRAVVEQALGAGFTVRWVVVGQSGVVPEARQLGTVPEARQSGTVPEARQSGTVPEARQSGTVPEARQLGTVPEARQSGTVPEARQLGTVHADELTVAAARASAADAGCVVTVGSGTITDIGKAAAPGGTPLVAVQTATSVNGYADPFSVLLRHGVKRTTPSRWPDALVVDPAVLQDAPAELNRAGAGDLMAMFTATADWYLASAMAPARPTSPDPHPGDPPYHPAVAGLARARGQRLLALAPRLGADPDTGSLAELADMLTLSGIAMGVAGSTAPSSGMEHAISHLLEMAATAAGRPANFHGAQVGVASVVAAQTWAHVLRVIRDGGLDRRPALPDPDAVRARIGRAFAGLDPGGSMVAECFDDYARKLRRLGSAAPLATLRSSWAGHRAALDDMLIDPGALAGALRSAGLPARFSDLAEPVDDATARWAVANCALQRQRLGVADLAMLLGAWEEADVDEVLAAAASPAAASPAADSPADQR
jgi:glycerol-1-phosphate dehydrogenase [NAD(P)+]